MTALVTANLSLLSEAPDGVERLRSLIVELAVLGRLVPQQHGDEHGARLAVRLAASKTRAAADGGRRAKALDRSDAPAWPFEIPASWTWQVLDDLLWITGGVTLGRKLAGRALAVLPYLRVANVQRGYLALDDLKDIEVPADEVDKYLLQAGDLLITEGGDWDKVGRTAIWQGQVEGCLHQNHVFRARPCSDEFLPRWAELYLNSPAARAYFAGSSKQTTNLASINMTQLRSCAFPLPPVAEQHRIVAKVDELMALCDRLEARQQDAEAVHARLVQALLDSLTQARDAEEFQACWQRVAGQLEGVFTTEASIDDLERAVLELAITGRMTRAGAAGDVSSDLATVRRERARNLTPAKLKKHDADAAEVYWACPYELPERWAWVSLAAVVLQITDGTHHTPTYVDQGTPFISVKDLDGETVSFEDCRHIPHEEHVAINERCNPERGDILICRIGTLGRPTIVDTDRAFSIFVSVGLLKMPKSIELADYIHLVLRSPLAYRQYDRIKAGGSHTNKLNLGDIPKIMVPLPPAEERAEILAVVREVLGLCSLLRSRIAAARGKHARLAEALVAHAVN